MIQQTYPLWLSHTSIGDFLSCPRAYYLRHMYKDPKTKNKINIVNPYLALGNTVHDVLESLSVLKAEERMKQPLMELFEKKWEDFHGEAGGFRDEFEEQEFKNRGKRMIQRVIDNPGIFLNKAIKLKSPDSLPPRFCISAEHNIILCGKIDWLEYFPEDDSVHIIDFKTGTNSEKEESLQLPIYSLLVKNCQKRNIKKISYWYLEWDNHPLEMTLPDLEKAYKQIIEIATQVKKFRQSGEYNCPKHGCFSCRPLQDIVDGNAKFIRTSGYQDIYVN